MKNRTFYLKHNSIKLDDLSDNDIIGASGNSSFSIGLAFTKLQNIVDKNDLQQLSNWTIVDDLGKTHEIEKVIDFIGTHKHILFYGN